MPVIEKERARVKNDPKPYRQFRELNNLTDKCMPQRSTACLWSLVLFVCGAYPPLIRSCRAQAEAIQSSREVNVVNKQEYIEPKLTVVGTAADVTLDGIFKIVGSKDGALNSGSMS